VANVRTSVFNKDCCDMSRYRAVGVGTRPRGSVAGNVKTFFSTPKRPGGLCTINSGISFCRPEKAVP
jgi:hypothetical protein